MARLFLQHYKKLKISSNYICIHLPYLKRLPHVSTPIRDRPNAVNPEVALSDIEIGLDETGDEDWAVRGGLAEGEVAQ